MVKPGACGHLISRSTKLFRDLDTVTRTVPDLNDWVKEKPEGKGSRLVALGFCPLSTVPCDFAPSC